MHSLSLSLSHLSLWGSGIALVLVVWYGMVWYPGPHRRAVGPRFLPIRAMLRKTSPSDSSPKPNQIRKAISVSWS